MAASLRTRGVSVCITFGGGGVGFFNAFVIALGLPITIIGLFPDAVGLCIAVDNFCASDCQLNGFVIFLLSFFYKIFVLRFCH